MQSIKISGELRHETGKKATKAVRKAGLVPCELYGSSENVHFAASPKAVKDLVYTPDFKVAELEIDGQAHRAIMKSIQFHPVSDEIMHIDFLRLVPGNPVTVEVPVRFFGVSPGVKSGGKLTQKVHNVHIRATPENLVEEVSLDISELLLGHSVRVRDIKVSENIQILNNPGIPLASVTIPRALKSADEEEEEEAAGTEEVVEETAAE
jgi:large subunit ribosomal protein L25